MAGALLQTFPIGSQWPTIDPFLFVAHHSDAYPNADHELGPDAPLTGRTIGQDFDDIDGWNMYHGSTVPGFPQHPHRGFETITYLRNGYCDHSDSLGATARFGSGDAQWMTAGRGIVHSEMFPLLDATNPNPLELFQIWLNLPSTDKMIEPYFTMLWKDDIPTISHSNSETGTGQVNVTVLAGSIEGVEPADPPPNSWASKDDSEVAIWHIELGSGSTWILPETKGPSTQRAIYLFSGSSMQVDNDRLKAETGAILDGHRPLELAATEGDVECMILQGAPIGEPVARYGPFVMNTNDEIQQAFSDYRQTQFGGWPWNSDDPNHGPEARRFAKHVDGRMESFDMADES